MEKIRKDGYYRKINIFYGMNVHENDILAKSSSDEIGFRKLVFMRAASKFV